VASKTRRASKKKEHATPPAQASPPPGGDEQIDVQPLPADDGDGKPAERSVSHQAHHRIIAQAVNHLIEAFNEFQKDTTTQLTNMKRQLKELDATIMKLQRQVEQQGQRLTEIDDDVMGLTLDNNLELRRLKAQVDALWEIIAANSAFDAAQVLQKREEVEAREDSRIDELSRELEGYAEAPAGRRRGGGRT
jgi:chromosome segregation ATPase